MMKYVPIAENGAEALQRKARARGDAGRMGVDESGCNSKVGDGLSPKRTARVGRPLVHVAGAATAGAVIEARGRRGAAS